MPGPSDRTPLLSTGNGTAQRPFVHRMVDIFKGPEDDPSWVQSLRFLFFGSWFNVLLVFVPLCIVADKLEWDSAFRFGFSFLAIVPLAKLLGEATEQLAVKLGQTLGGLLNASFGNAVEIIVGVSALLRDEIRIVQTSLLGSILGNILLVLGCSFVAGGLVYSESSFQVTAAQASASLMTLSCITLVIPAAYHSATHNEDPAGLLIISRGTAILLLGVYAAYLVFQLKTHAHLFVADAVGEEEEEPVKMNVPSAAFSLLATTVVTAFCADVLVASIEETARVYHIPKAFIGLILLPIVGNAAEHVTSVWMAMKNKMELTIGICVGSSIQIASFVVPLLVIVGWITGHNLTLFFADFETIVLFVSVILVSLLIIDGKSNYMEGLILLALYGVIGIASWVS